MKKEKLFTSESVSEGHPDKVCDQISDAILDACLEQDINSRVACEVFITTEKVIVGGEITTTAVIDYDKIVRNTLRNIGYLVSDDGISCDECEVIILVKQQSNDISNAVSNDDELKLGAGDQGFVFGYATNETAGNMPLGIAMAHKLVRVASSLRKNGNFKWAKPDMKSQVVIDYSGSEPYVKTVLMSIQHDESYNKQEFDKYIHETIMLDVVKSFGLNTSFEYFINPSGRFVIGGPLGDTGLTGRKIIVDTYGGSARHGGGAFSGKDPSKVDRSAAYMARYIATNIVGAKLADRIEVQIGYGIGLDKPLSVAIDCFGTSKEEEQIILEVINELFDMRPGAIIKQFSLKQPNFKYQDTASYGHFGRPDLDLPWEKLDKVEKIISLVKLKKR